MMQRAKEYAWFITGLLMLLAAPLLSTQSGLTWTAPSGTYYINNVSVCGAVGLLLFGLGVAQALWRLVRHRS